MVPSAEDEIDPQWDCLVCGPGTGGLRLTPLLYVHTAFQISGYDPFKSESTFLKSKAEKRRIRAELDAATKAILAATALQEDYMREMDFYRKTMKRLLEPYRDDPTA